MIRAFREKEGWWLELMQYEGFAEYDDGTPYIPVSYDQIADMPAKLADKLTLLVHAEVGTEIEDVGKRISEETFWLYVNFP